MVSVLMLQKFFPPAAPPPPTGPPPPPPIPIDFGILLLMVFGLCIGVYVLTKRSQI